MGTIKDETLLNEITRLMEGQPKMEVVTVISYLLYKVIAQTESKKVMFAITATTLAAMMTHIIYAKKKECADVKVTKLIEKELQRIFAKYDGK